MTVKIPEPIALVIAALRSDKYNQTIGTLEDESGFCCLGVIGKVGEACGIRIDPQEFDSLNRLAGNDFINLPDIQEWVNFCGSEGNFENAAADFRDYIPQGGCKADSLMEMNDTYNFTFAQIADFIEDNWQILVKEPI
jgi:hypothetical protein